MLLYSAREQQLRNCIPVGIHLNLIKGSWPRINQSQCSNIESILAVMNTTELVVEIRTEKKNSGPYGIWTHDLCDTGAALYLTSQLRAGYYVGSK